jgi:hypothetical protein
MRYSFEMGSIKIEKFMGRIHRQHGDSISILLFFQNKESRSKNGKCIHNIWSATLKGRGQLGYLGIDGSIM